MARISELEQRGDDTLEIAIKQSEFDRLGSATDPFELRITILSGTGAEIGTFLLPTTPASWVQDPETLEYIYSQVIVGFGNHRTNWDGLVLSSLNAVGLDTVEDGLMIAPFNEAVDVDGVLATTVSSATFIPVGTPLILIDQSVVTGSGSGATLRFDAPDVNTPIVSFQDGIGDTGLSPPPPCFVSGTSIHTPDGEVLVEDLKVGDLVSTLHNGAKRVLWIGSYTVSAAAMKQNDKLCPVLIKHGALATDMPARDTYLSRQHRVLIWSHCVQTVIGQKDALVAAHRLTRLNGVRSVRPQTDITYLHILLDQHDVLIVDGLPAESLLMAAQPTELITADDRAVIEKLVEHNRIARPCVEIPTGQMQKNIVRCFKRVLAERPKPANWLAEYRELDA